MSKTLLQVWPVALAIMSTATLAAEPKPNITPVPSWVKPVAIPDPNPAKKDSPLQMLLLSGQSKLEVGRHQTFVEFAMLPQTVAGLQGAGTIGIPWNSARTSLNIHAIEIHRGGKTIDLLKGAEFTILRRETGLERAARLDGVRTAVLAAKGLQVGDIIRVAATYDAKPGTVDNAVEDISTVNAPFDVARVYRRYLVAPGANIQFRSIGKVDKPVISQGGDGAEYVFSAANVTVPKYPEMSRVRDTINDIQFSSYQSWSQVADSSISVYAAARKVEPGSPLALEADKIAAETNDPVKRMMAALRLTQEQVRYVAVLLGEGAYLPTSASETWEQKFGDCKAKSAMLLALLDRLGIAANALYVSSGKGEVIGDRLPSLATFDHVIVSARIGDKSYYLDGTDYGQRTAEDVSGTSLHFGLPIRANAQLEKLPPIPVSKPIRETSLTWDGSAGVIGELPFWGTLTLRSVGAIDARLKKASTEKPEDLEKYFEDLIPGVSNDDLKIVSQVDDEVKGEYVVTFKGNAKLTWDQYDGMKGYRFTFSNDASSWEPKFDREEGRFKENPVRLNDPYWQREIETLIVPASGKPFTIDAPALDETVAATRITRSVTAQGNRFTATTDFRRLSEDITAEEARNAKVKLDQINENWAFVVAPRGFKLPRETDKSKKE